MSSGFPHLLPGGFPGRRVGVARPAGQLGLRGQSGEAREAVGVRAWWRGGGATAAVGPAGLGCPRSRPTSRGHSSLGLLARVEGSSQPRVHALSLTPAPVTPQGLLSCGLSTSGCPCWLLAQSPAGLASFPTCCRVCFTSWCGLQGYRPCFRTGLLLFIFKFIINCF